MEGMFWPRGEVKPHCMAQELQFDFVKATTVLQSHQGGLGLQRDKTAQPRADPPPCSCESRHKFVVLLLGGGGVGKQRLLCSL